MGAGFDCASMNEMKLVLKCGCNPDKIIYAHTIKPHGYIEFAK